MITLTVAEREALVDAAQSCADIEWESLVPESDIASEWSDDANEPWHTLSRSWRCDHDECEACDCYTDDDRNEAHRIYGAAAGARWESLLEEQRERARGHAARLLAGGADDDLTERVVIALIDDDEPGVVEHHDGGASSHARRLASDASGWALTVPGR